MLTKSRLLENEQSDKRIHCLPWNQFCIFRNKLIPAYLFHFSMFYIHREFIISGRGHLGSKSTPEQAYIHRKCLQIYVYFLTSCQSELIDAQPVHNRNYCAWDISLLNSQ